MNGGLTKLNVVVFAILTCLQLENVEVYLDLSPFRDNQNPLELETRGIVLDASFWSSKLYGFIFGCIQVSLIPCCVCSETIRLLLDEKCKLPGFITEQIKGKRIYYMTEKITSL